MAWSGHVNQKVNETKACPTMLLVCAPVTKKDKLEKQIAPETLLAQISAENGRPEQSEGIPGELCRSILFFFSATLLSWAEVHAFEAACLGKPFCSSACLFLLSCRPCFRLTRVCLCFFVVDNLQSRRQVQFHHRVWQPEGFCFKRLFALSFWYAGKMPENDLPCSCSPA